jgi:cell division protease FtsH
VAGLEKKSRRLSDKVKRVVAFHESGHAICAAASPGADPVQKISIIPRGIGALGYTLQTPLEDRYLHSEQDLLNRIVTLYGGRVAEELVFGKAHRTTGASDDIRKASDLARRMVAELGMSDNMGAIHYGGDQPNPFGIGGASRDVAISEDTARMLDQEVRSLLENAKQHAQRVLEENRELLHHMAEHLLQHETLERSALYEFLVRTTVDGQAVSLPDSPAPVLPERTPEDFDAALAAASSPTDGAEEVPTKPDLNESDDEASEPAPTDPDTVESMLPQRLAREDAHDADTKP